MYSDSDAFDDSYYILVERRKIQNKKNRTSSIYRSITIITGVSYPFNQ